MYSAMSDGWSAAEKDPASACLFQGDGDSFTAEMTCRFQREACKDTGERMRHRSQQFARPPVDRAEGKAMRRFGRHHELLHCDLYSWPDTAKKKWMAQFVNLALVKEAATSWLCRRGSRDMSALTRCCARRPARRETALACGMANAGGSDGRRPARQGGAAAQAITKGRRLMTTHQGIDAKRTRLRLKSAGKAHCSRETAKTAKLARHSRRLPTSQADLEVLADRSRPHDCKARGAMLLMVPLGSAEAD